jgi:peptide/nickel transport system permease protein
MSADETATHPVVVDGILRRYPQRAVGPDIWRFAKRKPLGAFGGLILIALCLISIFGDTLAPHDPARIVGPTLQGPSADFPFGTDWLGRDMLSRTIVGARTSFFTSSIVVLVAAAGGLVLGAMSAYFGGNVDLVMQRVIDAVQAIPLMVLALSAVAVFGPGVWHHIPLTVVTAMTLVFIPLNVRVVRASALSVLSQPYMEASRALGAGHVRRISRHMFPNLLAPVVVLASIQLGAAVLVEAGLAFLGAGVPPPAPTWGGMLSGEARTYMQQYPHLAIFPGLALSVFVIGINFLGDALRDVLDPRLRGGM